MPGLVTFTPTLADHVAGQRLWLFSYYRRSAMIVVLVVVVVLIILGLVGASIEIRYKQQDWLSALSDVAPLILLPLLFTFLHLINWLLLPKRVRRLSQQQPTLLAETSWAWDDNGVQVRSAAGSSNIPWCDLYRWLSGQTSIVLTPQERLLLIMPRRAADPAISADLERTIRRFATRAKST